MTAKRMFELGAGAASKFWEVWRDGSTVFTRFGKSGMKGQTRLKKEADEELAEHAVEKMIGEKIRSGYVELGNMRPIKTTTPTTPTTPTKKTTTTTTEAKPLDDGELKRKLAGLTDDASHLVLADWLEEHGHPLGGRIVLQHALSTQTTPRAKRAQLEQAVADILTEHGGAILGAPLRAGSRFTWHLGLLESATVATSMKVGDILRDLKALLSSPVAQRLASVIVQPLPDTLDTVRDYDDCRDSIVNPWPNIDRIAALLPASVTHFGFGGWPAPSIAAYVQMPNLTEVSKALPNLHRLELTGSYRQDNAGILKLAQLTDLAVRFADASEAALATISLSTLPKLERLTVWIGGMSYCVLDDVYIAEEYDDENPDAPRYPETFPGSDLDKMDVHAIYSEFSPDTLKGFLRKLPGNVKHLSFQGALLSTQLYEALATQERIDRLETLDLSNGYLDDEQSRVLIAAKRSLAHLQVVDVTNNRLSEDGAQTLARALPNVRIGHQREIKKQSDFLPLMWHPDEPDRFFMRYVAGKE